MMPEPIEEAITEQFGERCPDFDADCICCQVWSQYDDLVEQRATVTALRTELEAVKREAVAHIAAVINHPTSVEARRAARAFTEKHGNG